MNIQNRILFRFFFIIAIIICSEVNSFSNVNKDIIEIECTESNNSNQVNLISDFDSLDDDLINKFNDSITNNKKSFKNLVFLNLHFTQNYTFLYWQPPKLNK